MSHCNPVLRRRERSYLCEEARRATALDAACLIAIMYMVGTSALKLLNMDKIHRLLEANGPM